MSWWYARARTSREGCSGSLSGSSASGSSERRWQRLSRRSKPATTGRERRNLNRSRSDQGSRRDNAGRGGGRSAVLVRWPITTERRERDRYDVLIKTLRTVAAYHRAPPCAVGTSDVFRASAILRS